MDYHSICSDKNETFLFLSSEDHRGGAARRFLSPKRSGERKVRERAKKEKRQREREKRTRGFGVFRQVSTDANAQTCGGWKVLPATSARG